MSAEPKSRLGEQPLHIVQGRTMPRPWAEGNAHYMERSATKEEVMSISATPYPAFRRHIETGDLLFGCGRSLFSRMIRVATRSPWSHVGIVVRVDAFNRVLLLESVESIGVRLTPLSQYFGNGPLVDRYDGAVVLARHTEVDPLSSAIRAMVDYGMSLVGKPHGVAENLGVALRVLLRQGGGASERRRAFVSSEFVDACFSHRLGGSYRPFFRAREQFISPADIWTDPRVMPVRRLVAEP